MIPGDGQSAYHYQKGCPFRDRCRHSIEECASADMTLHDLGGGHQTACIRTARREIGHDRAAQRRRTGDGRRRIPARPRVSDLLIRNARVAPRAELVDLGVRKGEILSVAPRLPGDAPRVLEAEGRLVVPAFVQPHLHLDKVCTAPLLSSNRTGTLPEAISLLQAIKSNATIEEVAGGPARSSGWRS